MKVKLQPPSATDLPAYNPILPPAAITQVMLLANPQKVWWHWQGLYNDYDRWLTVFAIKYVITQNWSIYLLLSQYALFSSISILKFVDTCCITFSLSILGKNSIKIQDYVQCKWRESIRCWRSWQFYNFIMLEQIHL